MASVSVSITRGLDGSKISDFTPDTQVTNAGDIELRVNLLDAQSNPVTRKDVYIALKAFQRWFDSFPVDQTLLPPL